MSFITVDESIPHSTLDRRGGSPRPRIPPPGVLCCLEPGTWQSGLIAGSSVAPARVINYVWRVRRTLRWQGHSATLPGRRGRARQHLFHILLEPLSKLRVFKAFAGNFYIYSWISFRSCCFPVILYLEIAPIISSAIHLHTAEHTVGELTYAIVCSVHDSVIASCKSPAKSITLELVSEPSMEDAVNSVAIMCVAFLATPSTPAAVGKLMKLKNSLILLHYIYTILCRRGWGWAGGRLGMPVGRSVVFGCRC